MLVRTLGSVLLIAALAASRVAPAASATVQNLVAAGNIEYRKLDYADAVKKYDAAIRKEPDHAVAHNNRGLALHKIGRLKEGVGALLRATQLDSRRAAFHLNLGKVYASDGQLDQALAALDAARAVDPNLAAAVYNKIWVLDEKGDHEAAAELAVDLTAMPNPPPGTKLLCGIVVARQGGADAFVNATFETEDLPQQWRWLAEANRCLAIGGLQHIPEDVRPQLREATRDLSAEQFSASRRRLAAIARSAKESPVPHWLYSMAWQLQGDKARADAAMRKAAASMPKLVAQRSAAPMEVAVDGEPVGKAPLTRGLLPGVHVVRGRRTQGGREQTITKCFLFEPGRTYDLLRHSSAAPPDMARAPAGPFKMGEGEQAHEVHVAAFCIAKHEVTNRQWQEFVDVNPDWSKERIRRVCHDGRYLEHWKDGSCPQGQADRPVVYVSWFAAQAYCEWAGGRLPTEAQWEKACRAGSDSRYCFGDDKEQLGEYAWYGRNSGRKAHPVGQKKPNAWGIHDMHGNVWEWTSSMHKDYPYKADDGREDAKDVKSSRVCRGGAWLNRFDKCFRCAHRMAVSPDRCSRLIGLRLCLPERRSR